MRKSQNNGSMDFMFSLIIWIVTSHSLPPLNEVGLMCFNDLNKGINKMNNIE
jgi:hypothetical protein